MNSVQSRAEFWTLRPFSLGRLTNVEGWLSHVALATLRYGLVLILLYYGAFKFTDIEARGIEPLIRHSPLLGWSYALGSVREVSALIGVGEIATALLIALRAWSAKACAIGSWAAVATFLVTLSFLFTTPGMWLSVPGFVLAVPNELGAFVLKDVFLLGAALLSAAETLAARRHGASS
jgi:reactive chlorine resistance protein C